MTRNTSTTPRPYRSHKIPACEPCRKRKARCAIDVQGQPCSLCKEKKWRCYFQNQRGQLVQKTRTVKHGNRPFQQRRIGNDAKDSILESGRLILGPAVAEDTHVVEQHLDSNLRAHSYHFGQRQNGGPVLYLTVPKHRDGLHEAENPGKVQMEIMKNILGPLLSDVIAL
jgi:hypothetical protein